MKMDEDSCFFGNGGTLAAFHRKSRCLRFWLYSGAFPHRRRSSHTSRIPPKESIIKTELLDRRYEDGAAFCLVETHSSDTRQYYTLKGTARFAGRINNNGIFDQVILGNKILSPWKMTAYPLNYTSWISSIKSVENINSVKLPAFYKTQFTLPVCHSIKPSIDKQ
ncbi:uncharacterized protein LOC132938037 [Metopolophium dirhodum]|uniref:uncharacterized protein LOC132938037 n=1 Tax=Metopolophium dirhodum TaxID=44670 RepID=UPI00298FE7D5|nr:uncharacterized protein LOC132938037 [Metopolophium dirhodum]